MHVVDAALQTTNICGDLCIGHFTYAQVVNASADSGNIGSLHRHELAQDKFVKGLPISSAHYLDLLVRQPESGLNQCTDDALNDLSRVQPGEREVVTQLEYRIPAASHAALIPQSELLSTKLAKRVLVGAPCGK